MVYHSVLTRTLLQNECLAAQEPSMQSILIIIECCFHLLSQLFFYDSWQMLKDPMSVEDLSESFLHIFSLV